MLKINVVLVCMFIAISAVFSQNLETAMKTDAIHGELEKIVSVDSITAYDNFIAQDGNEYVIISIDHTPSFLMRIDKHIGGFGVSFVTDNAIIDSVLSARYAQIESQKKNITELTQTIRQDMKEFNESRFLHEAKYDLILGINNSRCSDKQECIRACKSTQVCEYALLKNGESIADDMLKYQQYKRELDSLIQKIVDGSGSDTKTETEMLSLYLDVVDKIKEEISKMQETDLIKQSHILYSGQIVYNSAPVNEAQEKIRLAIEPARAADERRRTIDSIKEVTGLRAPRIQPDTQNIYAPANIERIGEMESETPGVGQNQPKQYGETYPPIAQIPPTQQGIATLENLALFFALLIVITTTVYVLYTVKHNMEKNQMPWSKRTETRGIEPFSGKKKIENLEDLL